MQVFYSVDLTTNSLFMYGLQKCVAIHIMPQGPEWQAGLVGLSSGASRRRRGMATFSSMHTNPIVHGDTASMSACTD